MADDPPDHLGHRRRLRARFMRDLGQSMPDYELLELLLTLALPRRDTKPLAKAMMARFGSLAGVLAAAPEALARVPGAGEAAVTAIKVAERAAARLLRAEASSRPAMDSPEAVADYCRAIMGRAPVEQLRLLFLDARGRLIGDEAQQTGTIDHTPAYPREVARRALEAGAAGLVIAHNHPSGDPTPSRADVETTRAVAAACATLDIALHDHIIVTSGRTASLRAMGLLDGGRGAAA